MSQNYGRYDVMFTSSPLNINVTGFKCGLTHFISYMKLSVAEIENINFL